MAATIFVPASTSPAKTVQSRAAGAAIELIPGSRQDSAMRPSSACDSISTVAWGARIWRIAATVSSSDMPASGSEDRKGSTISGTSA